MALLLYIIGFIIAVLTFFSIFFYGFTFIISGFISSVIFFALGRIISNQETILAKMDLSDKKVDNFVHIDKIECPNCHYKYDYDRSSCPKCGHKNENTNSIEQ